MATPKLLAQIVIPAGGYTFGYARSGAKTVVLAAGTYASILEVGAEFETKLQADSAGFSVACSSTGFISVTHSSADWTWTAATTTDALETLVGLAGTESVTSRVLTGTLQHRYGWYSPVGCDYPLDKYEIGVVETETDAGGLTQYASSTEHRYRELRFALVSPEAMAEGGTEGGKFWTNVTLLDLWKYVRDKPFRFYADCGDGTVASPGTEGTEYVTLRRMGRRFEPEQVDPDDWAYWETTLECKVTT
jgi:hypothetical protein